MPSLARADSTERVSINGQQRWKLNKEHPMATKKGKKGRTPKKSGNRKSRLWLRDLLNILGGLLVGALGVWILQGYLQGRAEAGVGQRYRMAIQQDLPILEKASDGYEAMAANEKEGAGAIQDVDVSAALYGIDVYERIDEDLPNLDADARSLLLAFYINLRDAELLRKLIVEQREHPEEMSEILTREFLRTLHEARELAPRLQWTLGTHSEQGGTP
jgi:hypothetical protein